MRSIPEWIRRLQPAKGSLLPVILAVEVTDVLFAVDSIPAVLAVSHDPFVVYTSNIAAILGLRSLYFALAALLDRLRYLHYGLGAMLAFVAFKMLASRWLEVPITISLAIMGAILGDLRGGFVDRRQQARPHCSRKTGISPDSALPRLERDASVASNRSSASESCSSSRCGKSLRK